MGRRDVRSAHSWSVLPAAKTHHKHTARCAGGQARSVHSTAKNQCFLALGFTAVNYSRRVGGARVQSQHIEMVRHLTSRESQLLLIFTQIVTKVTRFEISVAMAEKRAFLAQRSPPGRSRQAQIQRICAALSPTVRGVGRYTSSVRVPRCVAPPETREARRSSSQHDAVNCLGDVHLSW